MAIAPIYQQLNRRSRNRLRVRDAQDQLQHCMLYAAQLCDIHDAN
jgi:hypothetical protein